METHVLLDVCKDSFERIRGVGNVELRVLEVDEKMRKIPFHAVVGTANSAMGVVPSLHQLIRCPLLQEGSPFVMPEFQPERELCLTDVGKMPHERLEILPCFQLRSSRHVACDDGSLMEMTHLDRDRKPLQQATSAITDDRSDLPSNGFQSLDAILVPTDGFVGKELPEQILVTMRTAPDHDAEEPPEVRRVHDDDHLIWCQFFLLNDHIFQLSLHPLRTASIHLCNLRMSLFAVRELFPDFCGMFLPSLAGLLAAFRTLPNLSTVVRAVLLEEGGIAMRTYFS